MDKTSYIDECSGKRNDTKFYQRLNEDITADIQKRVTVYVNKMYNDKLNDKTKQYLIQTDVIPARFTFYLKYTNPVIQNALLFHLIAFPANTYPISLTTMLTTMYMNYHPLLKTLTIS